VTLPESVPEYIWVLFILAPLANTWIQRQHGKKLDAVNEQVSNTHDTNLRDDLDKIAATVQNIDARLQRLESGGIRGFLKGIL